LPNEKRMKKAEIEVVETAPGCPECAGLRAELVEAKRKRDAALLELAREREAFNALRLSFPPMNAAPPPPFQPAVVPPAPPPLRYVLVDRANEQIKRYLGPMHSASKRMATATLRLLNRGR
jgi:hypothetical protein